MDYREQEIWEALYDAYSLDDSESKTAFLENLLAEADAKNLDSLSFSIRLEIIQSTVFSGDIQKALVMFTHCIAEFDAEKEYALKETFSVLWSAKWINRMVVSFPTISKKQIESIESDIADRFQKHGFGLRAHFMFGWINAIEMGDKEKAIKRRKQWLNETCETGHQRCRACESHYEMRFQIESRNIEKGLGVYRRLLRSGDTCNLVPLASHLLALPFLGADDHESQIAFDFSVFAFDDVSIDQVSLAAQFLLHLLAIQDRKNALKIVSNYLGHAIKTNELDQKLRFFTAATCFFGSEIGSTFSFPWTHLGHDYDLNSLKAFLNAEISRLASAFDLRNENNFVSNEIQSKRNAFGI